MNENSRQLLIALAVVLALAGGLGWWAYQATQPSAVVTTPAPVQAGSPLASPALEVLRSRTIYGSLPVEPPGPTDRTDPFVTN